MFPGNKRKAVTFSFDDGVTQDRRLISLFNKYNLKGTFNLNSELFEKKNTIEWQGKTADHIKIKADEVKDLYKGHEVAVHTILHADLRTLSDADVIKHVETDRINLERLTGYPIVGMAYPYGTTDDRIINLLRENTKILYSRGVDDTFSFDLCTDSLLNYRPTVHTNNLEKVNELAEEFIELSPGSDKVLYIWGHAYEFDLFDSWNEFEKILKKLSGKADIYYGTNRDILLRN